MVRVVVMVVIASSLAVASAGHAGGLRTGVGSPAEDGFVPLFNGRDLSGWVNVNCAPGTFFVKGDEVVTTGRPTGFLRTERMYENFVLELDWMHVEKVGMANSGVFVWGDPLPAVGTPYTRGIEVQVLCNYESDWATSHGDLFSIWGARCTPDRPHPRGYERCLPSERRCKGGGEWNHYKVTCTDGTVKLEVNGKEVSGVSRCNPRKGYLALESEGAECHFRNVRVKELPSTSPGPDATATGWAGHTSLFNGLDLTGWAADGWAVADGRLVSAGAADLSPADPLPAGELIFDWKKPGKGEVGYALKPSAAGDARVVLAGKGGAWQRATVAVKDGGLRPAWPGGAGVEVMNVFFRAAKGQ